MALKIDGEKTFPDKKTIVKLGLGVGIKHPNFIIEEIADLLNDFIDKCDLINRIEGFRRSLRSAIDTGTRGSVMSFRIDKNKKH